MEGDGDEGALLLVEAHEVGVEAAEGSLVADDEDGVAGALQFQHDGLQPLDHILVALPPRVPIRQLVRCPCRVLLWHLLRDLVIRVPVAYPRVYLIQPSQLQLWYWDIFCRPQRTTRLILLSLSVNGIHCAVRIALFRVEVQTVTSVSSPDSLFGVFSATHCANKCA